jgi:hypothetical protein
MNNIRKAGFGNLLQFQEDFSHCVLPRLLDKKEVFDFIFIDGNHRFDGIFINYYYSDLLLARGGYFMFHDTWMHSTQLVMSCMKANRPDYTVIEIAAEKYCHFSEGRRRQEKRNVSQGILYPQIPTDP